jgi:hypothetical protein
MGQAAIDLPDPAESVSTDAGPSLASADDLLAQLAGQEIDRLLADADPAPATKTSAATESATAELDSIAEDHPDANAQRVQQLLDPASVDDELLSKAMAKGNRPEATTPVSPDEAYAAQVDQLFKQLSDKEPAKADSAPAAEFIAAAPTPAPGPEALATPVPTLNESTPAANSETTAPAIEADIATSAAERAALNAPAETPAAAPVTEPPAAPTIEKILQDIPSARVPIYLRILETLNTPFAACPEFARDLLGKVAILTMMNSVGLLLYVLLFKK